MKKIIISVLFCSLISINSYAQPAATDFNSDGSSDLSAVIEAGNNLTWSSIINGDLEIIATGFGEKGDLVASANYNSASSMPAVIKKNGNWRVLDGDNVRTFKHGNSKTTFIAGADFDGDGYSDAAYATNACTAKSSTLKVLANPLSNSETIYSVKGGKGNFFKTFADINGDNRDDYCFAQPKTVKKVLKPIFELICKDVLSGQTLKKINIGRISSVPQRVRNNSGADSIAVINFLKNKTSFRVYDSNGNQTDSFEFSSAGTIVIGNYTNIIGQTEQIVLINNNIATIYNLDSNSTSTTIAPNGSIFDDINISTFIKNAKNCGCKSRDIVDFGSCPSLGCQVERDINDGVGSGFLHKPVSDSTGSIVNLLQTGEFPTSCRYETDAGQVYRDAFFASIHNGNRVHYRPVGGGSCSIFPEPLVLSCELNGRRNCWRIPDPCKRYD